MGVFFIDTSSGQVATQRQLADAGLTGPDHVPPRPWLRIQGSRDASTMWYAVLRKRCNGIVIGSLALRHGAHHASLLEGGWEEVPIEEIGPPAAAEGTPQAM